MPERGSNLAAGPSRRLVRWLAATPHRDRGDWEFAVVATLLYVALLVPRVARHVMWRDEWQAWLVATEPASIAQVVARVTEEGHPPAWHLMLRAIDAIGLGPPAMQVLHGAFAATTALLLLALFPAGRWLRLLLPLGYAFFFEWAVLSRSYAPAACLLVAATALMARRPRTYLAQAALLAIAMQFQVLAAALATAIAGAAAAGWLADRRPRPLAFAGAVVLVVASLGLLAAQLGKPARAEQVNRVVATGSLDATAPRDATPSVAGRLGVALAEGLVPAPPIEREWWGHAVLVEPVADIGEPARWLLLAAAIAWLTVLVLESKGRGNPRAWALLALGLAGLAVPLLVAVHPRHTAHAYLLAVLVAWLAHGARPRRAPLALAALVAVQAWSGATAGAFGAWRPLSQSRAAAAMMPPDAVVMAHPPVIATSVAGPLGRPIVRLDTGEPMTFATFRERFNSPADAALAASAAVIARDAASSGKSATIAWSLERPVPAAFFEVGFELEAELKETALMSERFAVLRWNPPPQ